MGKTALLVCDVQAGVVNLMHNTSDYLSLLSSTISAARGAGIHIVYIMSSFRPGYPEASARNMSTARLATMGPNVFVEGDASVGIRAEVAPAAGDIIVTKRRVSAFSGTDLEVVLRGLDVHDLVVCGLSTSGVVLSTVRQGADLDYRLTVLEDLCMDRDEEVHRVLMGKVFPRQADVVGWSEWLKKLGAAA